MQNRRWMQLFKVPAFCILHSALLISLAACGSRARAETVPDGPPLAVPLPPAHAIAIEQVAEAPPPEPPAPEPAPPEPRPATTVTRTPAPRETPAPVAAPPAPAAQQPPAEAPAVRATASAADEQRVRELLKKATTDLGNVNYQRLSKEGKSQYDQSKKFSDEAQQAIKEKNFVYALTLADKAATLAAELVR
jgi:histone H3/H4